MQKNKQGFLFYLKSTTLETLTSCLVLCLPVCLHIFQPQPQKLEVFGKMLKCCMH